MPSMSISRHEVVVPPGFSPRLLSTDVAAAYCGVGRDAFLRLARKAGVKPTPIGTRRKVWDVQDLDKAIDRLKGEPTQDALTEFEV